MEELFDVLDRYGFNQVSGSVSVSRRAKMTHDRRKNYEIS
jgi:virulence-associated protein VapD